MFMVPSRKKTAVCSVPLVKGVGMPDRWHTVTKNLRLNKREKALRFSSTRLRCWGISGTRNLPEPGHPGKERRMRIDMHAHYVPPRVSPGCVKKKRTTREGGGQDTHGMRGG